jgi:hypothetical protein
VTTDVKYGDIFTVLGGSGVEVSITNKGAYNFHADCIIQRFTAENNAALSFDF